MKKMQTIVLKLVSIALVLAFSATVLVGCKDNEAKDAIKISFKSSSSFDYLKSIDGETVTINGYMATSSPVDGSFMFLMNLPYQSCPFCVPNTSQLSNTLEVYPKKGESFDYTNQAIKVVGKLEVAPSVDEFFEDEYGYQFNVKIVDATYTILKAQELSADLAIWQRIAESNIINKLYAMYDYLNFLCAWNTYYVNSYIGADGTQVKGYYLNSEDAIYYITTDGAQWNYGYKEGYFDALIRDVKSIDENVLNDLVSNIEKAKALAEYALGELNSANYSREYLYIEKFDTYNYVYTLNNEEELNSRMQELYAEFSGWLGNWEM